MSRNKNSLELTELNELRNPSTIKKNKVKKNYLKLYYCCECCLCFFLSLITILCCFCFSMIITFTIIEFVVKKYINLNRLFSDFYSEPCLILLNFAVSFIFCLLFCYFTNIISNCMILVLCSIKKIRKKQMIELMKETL